MNTTDQTINDMKELTKEVKRIREKLEKEAKSFMALQVAEADGEYLFISSLSIGSISSEGTEQLYVDEDFVQSFANQYKEFESC